MSMRVRKAGFYTTVQDLGRPGWRKDGVPAGGAMDAYALRTANLLVGNEQGAAGLELTLVGPELEATDDLLLAVCGAYMSPLADGEELPMWRPVMVAAGTRLKFGPATSGCRAYIAVAGGIAVAAELGSRSTDTRLRIGGIAGRRLEAGDVLPCAGLRPAGRGAEHFRAGSGQATAGEMGPEAGGREGTATAEGVPPVAGGPAGIATVGDALLGAGVYANTATAEGVPPEAGGPAGTATVDETLPVAGGHAGTGTAGDSRPVARDRGSFAAPGWFAPPVAGVQAGPATIDDVSAGPRKRGSFAAPGWFAPPLAYGGGSEDGIELRAMPGAEFGRLGEPARRMLFGERYRVAPASDRMGVRLDGPPIAIGDSPELLSHGVVPGTVQLPAGGMPIILAADCQTTGGYPKIAHVIAADLPLLAQAKPGDSIRFTEVSLAEAQRIELAFQQGMRQLAAAIALRLSAGGGAPGRL